MSGLGQRARFDTYRTIDASSFTSSFQMFGAPLAVVPRLIIIQNNTATAVALTDSLDTGIGIIFQPTERVVLDLDSNKDNKHFQFGFAIGTQFYILGASSSGQFNMSIIYAESTNP